MGSRGCSSADSRPPPLRPRRLRDGVSSLLHAAERLSPVELVSPTGELPKLERMSLSSCSVDVTDLVLLCPRFARAQGGRQYRLALPWLLEMGQRIMKGAKLAVPVAELEE
ncbi:hypothetical protein QYE76_071737 [Lolium multiflorum]|uniref:Uncharacterized protein n=1 Tax=Lolium multiflorum TaxID=4521 RepID=A0AAD8SKL4_LOLMU|nr:hypothetical protein QYE76_071737 [Lolium multiflorum]